MNNNIIINSLDRNWLSGEKTFSYTLNFNNTVGSFSQNIKNIKEFHIESLIMPDIFTDIFSVHCSKKIGFNSYTNNQIDVLTPNFPKLSELKFIIVDIEELEGNTVSTNKLLKKTSSVFIFDNVISRTTLSNLQKTHSFDGNNVVMHTNTSIFNRGEGIVYDKVNEFIVFKNISPQPTFFKKDLLNTLTINFLKPNGEKIKLMNDTLKIKQIFSKNIKYTFNLNSNTFTINNHNLKPGMYLDEVSAGNNNTYIISVNGNDVTLNRSVTHNGEKIFQSRKIEIEFTEYFSSEEYKLGDTIIFKNLLINNKSNLISFLERNDGHVIVGMSKNSLSSSLYNIIEILPAFSINLSTGEEITDYYGLDTIDAGLNENVPIVLQNGIVINNDLQHIIGINVKI